MSDAQSVRFEIRVRDLPRDLLDAAANFVNRFSTPLILNDSLAGSGTFIRCGRSYGILTAHHVVHNPTKRSRRFDFSWGSQQLLNLPLINRPHRFDLPMRLLHCVDVGVPTSDDSGPDLAVLILPENKVGEIAARMSFIDISVRRNQRLTESLVSSGLWVVAGSPIHYQQTLQSSHGFGSVINTPCVIACAAIGKRFEEGEFDFLQLDFHASESTEMPASLAGMSGGGVWKLPLQKDRETLVLSINFEETVFAGVCFYEMLSQNRLEAARCHGGRSIYQKVYQKLLDNA